MKNSYATSKGNLVLRSGIGISNYTIREEGTFQVRLNNQVKNFKTLIAAALYFEQALDEASVWDMTGEPILVETKFVIS